MAATLRETEAIVLDCRDHGESDLIVTLFSHEQGKSTAIAKGAKRSKKRFVNKLELFSFLHVTLRESRTGSLALLQEAELHTSFITLRKNVTRYTAASVIREFILSATSEGEEDHRIFQLALWALHSLDQAKPHLTVVTLFLIRFYDYIGYRPELHRCLHCGTEITAPIPHSFSITGGGLACRACNSIAASPLRLLSPGTIKLLRSSQNLPLERLHRVKITGTILYESLDILHRYGRYILQRDITSWRMLRLRPERTRP